MRLAGTAVVCIAAAFGAAFLVGRAVGHSSNTKQPHVVTTVSTAKTTSASAALHTRLLAEFKPIHAPRVVKKPKVRHQAKPKTSSTPSASASAVPATQSSPSSSSSTPASTYTAPTYSAPAAASSTPTHSSGSTGSGSGTTTVGGSSKSSGGSSGSTKLGG